MNRTLPALVVFSLLGPLTASAAEWPQFRGPTGQGHARATGLPLLWSETRNVAWKVAIPGTGWSSPVIWDERIFLTTAVELEPTVKKGKRIIEPGKIERMDSAILLQPSGYFVRLVSPRPWDEYGVRVGNDFVRVQGVFFKRWQYIPKEQPVPLEIPLVVVTDIQLVDLASNQMMAALQWVFIGLAVVIVGVFVSLALRDRKARAVFRERVREKGRKRKDGASGGAED